jgi:hypothetical protein
MEVPTLLTRPASPLDIQRNWKADEYGICGQFVLAKWRLSGGLRASATLTNWARDLPINVEVNRDLLAGGIGRR